MTEFVVHVPEDRTDELARTIGLTSSELADLIGAPWRLADGEPAHDFDLDPSDEAGMPVTPWHVSGDPAQLMVRVFDHGVFLGRPVGRWEGTHTLVHDAVDQQYVSRFEIGGARDVARRLVTRRRRSFRWCRFCRRPFGPEERDGDICHGCESVWLGVVY